FRGDTIHPSTLELMAELGLDDAFLKLPHEKLVRVSGQFGDRPLVFADFSRLPVRHPYTAIMPQWDFLNFLAEQGRRYPGFTLLMETTAEDFLYERDRIAGVKANAPDGPLEIVADLVVAADGRHSVLRSRSGLPLVDL